MIKIEEKMMVDLVIATDKGVPLIKRKYPIKPIKRGDPTYKGCWANPSGHVDPEDYSSTSSAEEAYRRAAIREGREETNLKVKIIRKIGVYNGPSPRQKKEGLTLRDPRGIYISHAYLAVLDNDDVSNTKAASDAKEIKFFKEIPKNIAFDHDVILRDSGLFDEDGKYSYQDFNNLKTSGKFKLD